MLLASEDIKQKQNERTVKHHVDVNDKLMLNVLRCQLTY